MSMGWVNLEEGRMAYDTEGQGPALLLIHSVGTSSWAWSKVIGPLSQMHTVYALDIPGHGDSYKPKRDCSIPDFAASIIRFMDAQGIRNASVVGNSVGAIIMAGLAVAYPLRIGNIVLVGCPGWSAEEAKAFLSQGLANYDEAGNPKPRTREEMAASFTNLTDEMFAKMNELRAKAGPWALKTLTAAANYGLLERLPAIKCSAMVLYGERDALREREQAILSSLHGAVHAVIPNAGHLPQLDAPRAFVREVAPFLE